MILLVSLTNRCVYQLQGCSILTRKAPQKEAFKQRDEQIIAERINGRFPINYR